MDCKKIESGSSSCQTKWKYDVFLSFRGEDTRNSFTDYLFGTLHTNGIVTFKDDLELKKGESISSELLQAIEESQILIIVFSKKYAYSTWCLLELSKIADCAQVPGQSVLPVFYDVNPSEVRKQSGNFEKAFEEHEERFKDNLEMVQRWREALTQVANLSGFDVRDKPQYTEIQKITEKVACLLGHKLLSVPSDIVGIHSGLEKLKELLRLDSDDDDVRVVGICGMGGIGKTTLATTLYDRISNQFDACCFIDDVSKIFEDHGPIGAQKELLCQTLNKKNLRIYNLCKVTNLIRTRLCHIKALIILDNVDQAEQLEKLAMKRELLGPGSRIIIISRDEHILREHNVDAVYRVQLLRYDHALQLFCRKAFKCDDIIQGYSNLTHELLAYANGLPLAIKVLGSFLSDRSVCEWKSALVRLRENPRKDIMDVLRISFDALEQLEKEIFLDIVCFYFNKTIKFVRNILDIRKFHPDIGLRVLIDKSFISYGKEYINMHGLLKELGWTIIKEKSPKEPRMWSRLWDEEDVFNVMLENKEAENVELINLYMFGTKSKKLMSIDALSKMSHLQVLNVVDGTCSGNLRSLSNELRYLSWGFYPFMCLPSSFNPDKLVELILPNSSIKQLWKGTKHLPCLRSLNLNYSENLIEMPNFGEFPNLEHLCLEGCIKLVQIDPSIRILRKLVSLNLRDCKSLISIPNSIFSLSSLEELYLNGCSKLVEAKYLEEVNINEITIQSPSRFSIYKYLMRPFQYSYSRRHGDSIGSMVSSLPRFPCSGLYHLDLSFCNILQIPYAIGELHCLEKLYLGGNKFDRLPSSMKQLRRLSVLSLEHCKELKYLPELPSTTVCPIRSGTCFGRYDAGLYVFNCPNLDEIESYYSMVFSWIIQLLKILMQPSVSFDRIDVVVPGSEIPRWFNIQNEGTSRSIDLSPVLHHNNCIAVAFCASFVIHHDPTWQCLSEEYSNTILPFFFFISPNLCEYSYPNEIPIHVAKEKITFDSDHLLILLFTRQRFIDHYVEDLNLHDITFKIKYRYPYLPINLKVKKIGYRCIFKEDLQQLNPQLMLSENVSVRKRKFLPTE